MTEYYERSQGHCGIKQDQTTQIGLGLVGIGLSVPFPLVMSATGRLAERARGSTLAAITTWGYFGMIAGPPVIGFIADQVGMRLALAPVVFLCVLAALCAPVVGTAAGKEDKRLTTQCFLKLLRQRDRTNNARR